MDQQLFSILELGPGSKDLVSSYTALNSSRGFVSSEQFLQAQPVLHTLPFNQSLFPRSFSESMLNSRPCRAPNRVIQETPTIGKNLAFLVIAAFWRAGARAEAFCKSS